MTLCNPKYLSEGQVLSCVCGGVGLERMNCRWGIGTFRQERERGGGREREREKELREGNERKEGMKKERAEGRKEGRS